MEPKGVVAVVGYSNYERVLIQALANVPVLKDRITADLNAVTSLRISDTNLTRLIADLVNRIWTQSAPIPHNTALETELRTKMFKDFLPEFLIRLHFELNISGGIVKTNINEVYSKLSFDKRVGNKDLIIRFTNQHNASNNSLIDDLFTVAVRTDSTCKNPTQHSTTSIEPMMVISLPLPIRIEEYLPLTIIYIPLEQTKPIEKVNVLAPSYGPVFMLRTLLEMKLNVNIEEKRSLVLAGIEENYLAAVFPDLVSWVSRDRSIRLYCYEVDDQDRFYDSRQVYDENYLRPLETKEDKTFEIKDLPVAVEVNKGNSSVVSGQMSLSSGVIGFAGCPFVTGDIWFGDYYVGATVFLVRIEVTSVSMMSDSEFQNYRTELLNKGIREDEVWATEKDPVAVTFHKFMIEAVVDVKKSLTDVERTSNRYVSNSSFRVRGPYLLRKQFSPDELKEHTWMMKDLNSLLENRDKTNFAEGATDPVTLGKKFRKGFLDQHLLNGKVYLRPYGAHQLWKDQNAQAFLINNNSGLYEELSEPFALISFVSYTHRYMSATLKRVELKRELFGFYAQKWKSKNWDTMVTQRTNRNPWYKELSSQSSLPLARNEDDRAMLIVCHRVNKKRFVGIPFVSYIDKNSTEKDLFDLLRNTFDIWLVAENKARSERDLGTIDDMPEFELVRANNKMETNPALTPTYPAVYRVGETMKEYSNKSLTILENNKHIWVSCDWDCSEAEFPFKYTKSGDIPVYYPCTYNNSSVNEALEEFTKLRQVNQVNTETYAEKCVKCDMEILTLQKEILCLPPILVMKFDYVLEAARQTQVDVPFKLNMREFSFANKQISETRKKLITNDGFEYDLLAVTAKHLVFKTFPTFVRSLETGEWYHYNNNEVKKVHDIHQVVSHPNTHILFYIKSCMIPKSWQ